MRDCVDRGSGLEAAFRFCPHCGAAQRLKLVEHFRGRRDLDDGYLRVSAYPTSSPHTRFSVWRGDRVEAAISLDPEGARRLGRFLSGTARAEPRSQRGSLRRSAQALRDAFAAR